MQGGQKPEEVSLKKPLPKLDLVEEGEGMEGTVEAVVMEEGEETVRTVVVEEGEETLRSGSTALSVTGIEEGVSKVGEI